MATIQQISELLDVKDKLDHDRGMEQQFTIRLRWLSDAVDLLLRAELERRNVVRLPPLPPSGASAATSQPASPDGK